MKRMSLIKCLAPVQRLQMFVVYLLTLVIFLPACTSEKLDTTQKQTPSLLVSTHPTLPKKLEKPTVPVMIETQEPSLAVETEQPFSGTNLATAKLSSPASIYVTDTPRMQKFAEDFQAFLEQNSPGTDAFSLVFQDIETGERFSLNENARYTAASCMKVGMAMVLAKLVHHGILSWDTVVPCEVDPKQYIYSDSELATFGEKATIGDLLIPVLRYSNNTATSILFNYTYENGKYMHYFMDEAFGMHYAKDVTMSAFEGAHLMDQLINNPENIPEYTFVLDQLRLSTWNEYLTKYLPKEICANKYGQINDVQHEIGAVMGKKPFIYAAYSKEMTNPEFYPSLGKFLYEWVENN